MITLQRLTLAPVTYGVLMDGSLPLCVTLERPWKDNKSMVSCIPPGVYNCVPHSGTRFKNVWRLEAVPKRSAILIHSANKASELEGCIAVGRSFYGEGISSSVDALNYLREILPKSFRLEVVNPK